MKVYSGIILLTILIYVIPLSQASPMSPYYNDYFDDTEAGSGASDISGSGDLASDPPTSLPYPTDDPKAIICGRKAIFLARIVGGTKAPLGAWPWQIGIKSCAGTTCKFFCGGTIVGKEWVITAAHCIHNLYQAHELFIEAGLVNQVNVSSSRQTFKGKEIHFQKDYNKAVRYDQDIAIIKLDKEVKYNDFIRPLCLNERKVNVGEQCVVTGFGLTSKRKLRGSAYLRQATIPIISRETCVKANAKPVTENMICAGFARGGIDSCDGDSGGPLSCYDNQEQRFFLGGIVSWGIGCGRANKYGVYTNVTQLVPWIKKIIKDI